MLDDVLGQDWLTPAIAFTVSVIGSFLGLAFTHRARHTTGFGRWHWMILAALALGGMAVWSMHFIAMMGFRIPGTAIRYDALLTLAGGAAAIVITGYALALSLYSRGILRPLLSGLLLGAGMIAMHHIGIASMNVHGDLYLDPVYVAASCAVAIIPGSVALWIAIRAETLKVNAGASVLMGIAITAMHYTGMAGVNHEPPESTRYGAPEGSTVSDLLLPMIVVLFVFLLICSLFLLLGPEEESTGYGRRPVHAAAVPPDDTIHPEDDGYSPRHSLVHHGAARAPEGRRPSGDVWTRQR